VGTRSALVLFCLVSETELGEQKIEKQQQQEQQQEVEVEIEMMSWRRKWIAGKKPKREEDPWPTRCEILLLSSTGSASQLHSVEEAEKKKKMGLMVMMLEQQDERRKVVGDSECEEEGLEMIWE
jgi:hypothetical protein